MTIVKFELENVKAFLGEVKQKLKHTGGSTDRKSGRTDGRIDRLVFFFLGSLVLKDGFDFYIDQRHQRRLHYYRF